MHSDNFADVIGVPCASETSTDDEVVETGPPSKSSKGKRKAGEKIEWSADEDDDAYKKFKNRA
jgi:hypothetical protein